MKTFGKHSVSSYFRIAVDIMLISESLTLLFIVIPIYTLIQNDSSDVRLILLGHVSRFIFGVAAILMTLQLRKLLNAFKKDSVFEIENVKRIKNISRLLFLYLIPDFIINLIKIHQAHLNAFDGTMRNVSVTGMYSFWNIFASVNFKLLFIAIVIYIIAHVFQMGYELKEQTALTI
jgi:hypothetical protein